MKKQAKRVALVTGGARRIGKSIAEHLHELGFDIALHYNHSAEDAAAMVAVLCRKRADSCRSFRADLREEKQVIAMAEAVVAHYARVDLLVNNASAYAPTPLASVTGAQFDNVLHANLRGPYFLIQGLLPALSANRGSVINILDMHIERPLPQFNAYTAAKAGMAAMTRSLAVELGPDIRVNGVAPGAILWPEEDDSYDVSMRAETLERTPLKRKGEPTDIARTVGFLACDAPFITGQVIVVDGGRSLTF